MGSPIGCTVNEDVSLVGPMSFFSLMLSREGWPTFICHFNFVSFTYYKLLSRLVVSQIDYKKKIHLHNATSPLVPIISQVSMLTLLQVRGSPAAESKDASTQLVHHCDKAGGAR